MKRYHIENKKPKTIKRPKNSSSEEALREMLIAVLNEHQSKFRGERISRGIKAAKGRFLTTEQVKTE